MEISTVFKFFKEKIQILSTPGWLYTCIMIHSEYQIPVLFQLGMRRAIASQQLDMGGSYRRRYPHSWMVFVRGKPNPKWIMTGGSPFQETSIWFMPVNAIDAFLPRHFSEFDVVRNLQRNRCKKNRESRRIPPLNGKFADCCCCTSIFCWFPAGEVKPPVSHAHPKSQPMQSITLCWSHYTSSKHLHLGWNHTRTHYPLHVFRTHYQKFRVRVYIYIYISIFIFIS